MGKVESLPETDGVLLVGGLLGIAQPKEVDGEDLVP